MFVLVIYTYIWWIWFCHITQMTGLKLSFNLLCFMRHQIWRVCMCLWFEGWLRVLFYIGRQFHALYFLGGWFSIFCAFLFQEVIHYSRHLYCWFCMHFLWGMWIEAHFGFGRWLDALFLFSWRHCGLFLFCIWICALFLSCG